MRLGLGGEVPQDRVGEQRDPHRVPLPQRQVRQGRRQARRVFPFRTAAVRALHRTARVEQHVEVHVRFGVELLDEQPPLPRVQLPVDVSRIVPATYSRCEANSTLNPTNGLRCSPVRNPRRSTARAARDCRDARRTRDRKAGRARETRRGFQIHQGRNNNDSNNNAVSGGTNGAPGNEVQSLAREEEPAFNHEWNQITCGQGRNIHLRAGFLRESRSSVASFCAFLRVLVPWWFNHPRPLTPPSARS